MPSRRTCFHVRMNDDPTPGELSPAQAAELIEAGAS